MFVAGQKLPNYLNYPNNYQNYGVYIVRGGQLFYQQFVSCTTADAKLHNISLAREPKGERHVSGDQVVGMAEAWDCTPSRVLLPFCGAG